MISKSYAKIPRDRNRKQLSEWLKELTFDDVNFLVKFNSDLDMKRYLPGFVAKNCPSCDMKRMPFRQLSGVCDKCIADILSECDIEEEIMIDQMQIGLEVYMIERRILKTNPEVYKRKVSKVETSHLGSFVTFENPDNDQDVIRLHEYSLKDKIYLNKETPLDMISKYIKNPIYVAVADLEITYHSRCICEDRFGFDPCDCDSGPRVRNEQKIQVCREQSEAEDLIQKWNSMADKMIQSRIIPINACDCTNCGAYLDFAIGYEYCGKCGHKIIWAKID